MNSAFLLVLCALCSPVTVATASSLSSTAEAVAAEQQSCESSSCALELLQRSALSFTKTHLSASVTPEQTPPERTAKITHYTDSACTKKDGSEMEVSAETDECLVGWNYTCSCSPTNEKIVIGHHYKYGCNDRSEQHARAIPVGRCMPGRFSDSDANVFVKVEDFDTCPCCGSKCSVYGDPHITVFDQAEVSLLNIEGLGTENDIFGYGDYWLVKSELVSVQGRYRKVVYPKAKFQEHSFLTGVAIGGPFLQGNILVIGPRDNGKVQVVNELGEAQEILKNGGMYKDAAGDLIEAHYREHARMVKGSSETAPGIYFHLPGGVKVEVNRFGKHLDFSITMTQEAAGGKVDGQCGNFNGNPADDSAGLIAARMGYEIPKDELLFLDEDKDSYGEEELVASPGSLSDGLSVLEEASEETDSVYGTPLTVYLYDDSDCKLRVSHFLSLQAGPEICELGWNFTCSCDGDEKRVIVEHQYPGCGPGNVVWSIPIVPDVCQSPVPSELVFGNDPTLPAPPPHPYLIQMATKNWRLDAQACPCCKEPAQCTLHGDPHITVFDKAESTVLGLLGIEPPPTEAPKEQIGEDDNDMYGWGDFWLVKSEQVLIQARYRKVFYPRAVEPLNHTYLTSVAVGGPFMRGHKIVVEPRNGVITWSLGQVHKPIFDDGEDDSSFEIENVIKGRYHNRSAIVPEAKPVVPGVDLELPAGVKVSVDRFSKHLDLQISMESSSGGPGGVDGQCGNYNGDASDDTAELINGRIGYQVPPQDSLFDRDPLDRQA